MSRRFETLALCFIAMFGISSSIPVDTPSKHDIRKCQPNFCEIARFKCESVNSCNGFLAPPSEPCQCCPTCVKFKEEGESCQIQEEQFSDKTSVSTTTRNPTSSGTETESSEDIKAIEPKENKKSTKPEKCKPGLTCLQGTCVVIF